MQIRGSHMARGRNGTWTLHIYWGSQAQLFRWCSLCGRFLGSGLRLAWMLMIWNCGIRFFCASFSQKIGRIESRLPFSPAVVGHVTTPWLTWIFFADCDLINTHTWLRGNETWTRVSCLVHLLLLWADAWLFCFPRSSFIRKIRSCNCCQKSSLRYIFFPHTHRKSKWTCFLHITGTWPVQNTVFSHTNASFPVGPTKGSSNDTGGREHRRPFLESTVSTISPPCSWTTQRTLNPRCVLF